MKLLEWTSELVTREAIQNTMALLPTCETAYQGTLPPKRLFSYPSNQGGRNAFPVEAAAVSAAYKLKKVKSDK